jgi:hypothetical protein
VIDFDDDDDGGEGGSLEVSIHLEGTHTWLMDDDDPRPFFSLLCG